MKWRREDYEGSPVDTARKLIGALLIRETAEGCTAVRITETEAYGGFWQGLPDDGAHAYKGRTARTEVLFGEPGCAYVYLIYGMYCCFNIVCEKEGALGCVLIRAGEPVEGRDLMQRRRGRAKGTGLTCGPGRSFIARVGVTTDCDDMSYGIGYSWQKGDSVSNNAWTLSASFRF